MPEKNLPVLDLLIDAFQKSKGETIDLIIEHDEIKGVTVEMFRWWGISVKDSSQYQMWYPEDQVSFEWEVPPKSGSGVTSIRRVEEKVGEFPASVLRMRREEPDSLNITRKYTNFRVSSILGPDDKPVAWVSHEYENSANGMKMRSVFRFPVKTPKRFLEAIERHCRSEMAHLSEFLPELYNKRR